MEFLDFKKNIKCFKLFLVTFSQLSLITEPLRMAVIILRGSEIPVLV